MPTDTQNFELTAELMGDFNFNRDNDGTLSYGKRAVVSVQIGSLVKDINISTTHQGSGESKKEITPNNFDTAFEDVFKIGLKVNVQPIINKYIELSDIEMGKDILKKTEIYKKEYNRSWVHKTKEINIEGLEISYMSEDDYVTKRIENDFYGSFYPLFTYKGISETIDYQDVSSTNYNSNMKYTLDGSITRHRRRSYKSLQKLAEMYIQLVDFKINSDQAAEIAKENKKLEEESNLNYLKDTFGCDAEVKREWMPTCHGRNRGYYSTNYYLMFNGKREKISFRVLNDLYTFGFGSFSGLTASQVDKIIQVLDEV